MLLPWLQVVSTSSCDFWKAVLDDFFAFEPVSRCIPHILDVFHKTLSKVRIYVSFSALHKHNLVSVYWISVYIMHYCVCLLCVCVYLFILLCVCVCACVRACVRACVCHTECVPVSLCVCLLVCSVVCT